MKALRIKLRQNQASYTREETVNNRMTYPLPQYSTVIGALHNACGYTSYHEMKVSVQGKYRNMQRELYVNHALLNNLEDDRSILIYLKDSNALNTGFLKVAEALKSQGNSFKDKRTIKVYDEEKLEEYISIKNISNELKTEKKKILDDKEKAWKEEKKRIKDEINKLEVKSEKIFELKKIIEEKDSEIKSLKSEYKQELFEKVDEPLSHFKTLTKGIQTQEVLYDVELVIHISADFPVLKDILEKQNNFVSLGRSEDFIELLEMKEVELISDISREYELLNDYSMYVNADCVNTDESGMGDYFIAHEGAKKPAKGTVYYVAKDYRLEGKKRVFNKIPCLYSSKIGIDESSTNALYDSDGGYIVNLN